MSVFGLYPGWFRKRQWKLTMRELGLFVRSAVISRDISDQLYVPCKGSQHARGWGLLERCRNWNRKVEQCVLCKLRPGIRLSCSIVDAALYLSSKTQDRSFHFLESSSVIWFTLKAHFGRMPPSSTLPVTSVHCKDFSYYMWYVLF